MTSDERIVIALLALARHGIPTDVQELLLRGDPGRGIPPGALSAAIEAPLDYVLVPEQPSLEMIQAGWQQLHRARFPRLGPGPGLIEAYKAMVAKAQEER